MRKLLLLLACVGSLAFFADAERRTITNDAFFIAADSTPIFSQGGGIFRFPGPDGRERFYWYGVQYAEAPKYLADPSTIYDHCTFEGVTCYSSDNLVDWTPEGFVLTPEELSRHARPTWTGRMGVARLTDDGTYALFIQHGNGVLIATSASPLGPFEWHRRIDMTSRIGTPNTGDQTVFTDPDTGISYLIYSYGRGRNRQYISRIGRNADGLVDLRDLHEVCAGESREGNCMFKHRGRYYMVASNIYGWDGSLTYYVAADSIYGPYTPVNDMQVMRGSEADYSHVSQTGFFYTLEGSRDTTVIFCGDRWADFAGNGLGFNQWVPLSFDPDGEPRFNSLSEWELDAVTGEWRVGPGNNYVLNGSFEADRRTVPLAVKPRQEQLTGWLTEIVRGTPIAIGDSLAPQLNYFTTREERASRAVTGEKTLNISDHRPYERRVSQTVASTPAVSLPDGLYRLEATVWRSGDFPQLSIGVDSTLLDLNDAVTADSLWQRVALTDIPVAGGSAQVVIHAVGEADATCRIDDITLRRQ